MPAAAACPPVPWPVGVDGEASEVRAEVVVRGDGIEVIAWEGPPVLVDAVRPTVADCALEAGSHTLTWSFPTPAVHLEGTLRTRGTRAPVPDAEVRVGERSTRTDDEGRFAFRNLPAGDLVVATDDTELAVHRGPDEALEIVLWAPPTPREDEVVVRYVRRGGGGVERRIPLEDRAALPGSLGDPLRALSVEPGLARTPYDAGWLLVRGGDEDETGIFLDGVRLPIAYHLGGYTSVLHPDMTEAVRFWPGTFPARYGDALAGVVDIVPRRDASERTRLSAGVNVVFAQAFAETPTRWGSVSFAARRSYLDGVLAVVLDPEAARIAPRFWDVQAQAHIGDATITALGLADAIDAPSFDNTGVLTLQQQAAQVQASVPVGALEIRPWLAWTGRQVSGDGVPQQLTELYPGLRVHLEDSLEGLTAHVGLEAERRAYTFDRDGDDRAAPLLVAAPYGGLSFGDPLSLWAELRSTTVWVDEHGLRHGMSPKAGLRWRIGDQLLSAGFGRSHQLPPPTLFLAVTDGRYLELERADVLEASSALRWRAYRLDLAVWSRTPRELALVEADGSVGGGGGRAWGLEGKLGARMGDLDATLLAQTTRSLVYEDLPEEAAAKALEQRVRLEFVALQALPRDWFVSTRARYTSGYPRLLLQGELGPTAAYDLLTQQVVDLQLGDDDLRLAPYASLDIKAGRRFTFRRWRLTASLDVQNVTNRRVVEPVITGFGDSRPSYGFGLPILPLLSFDGEWFVD